MTLIVGKYQHYRNEDIDDFFSAVGVPYVGRKMINFASPSIEITLDGDMMTLKESALVFTSENTFKLGHEYDEKMPRKTLKSITTVINDHELVTNSVIPDTGDKCTRHYHFTEDECVVDIYFLSRLNVPVELFANKVKGIVVRWKTSVQVYKEDKQLN